MTTKEPSLEDGPLTPPATMLNSLADLSSAPTPPSTSGGGRNWRFATECATVENPSPSLRDQHGSSSVPIYQTATFKGMEGNFDYTRSGNPTRSFLEHHLKKISGAASAHVVSSGMSALDLILRLVKPGETLLAGDDLYGGTNRLLGWLGTEGGVKVHHVDTTHTDALKPFLVKGENNVSMVLLESPTNPMLKIADIKAIVNLVRQGAPNAIIVLDNTMMSPYLQRPLEFGVDIVYDSGTKYLSGHHDLMAGVAIARTEEIGKRLAWFVNAMGTGLAPFDSFLLLRGLKTLPLRLDRQQSTTTLIAYYLHTLGFSIHYPGLASDPGHALHFSQATGAGAVLSFETGDVGVSEGIVAGTSIFGISVSFGAVNSLISMPCLMSHASIPAHLRAERGLPEHLIRLCIGIEDPTDLIDDLESALLSAGAIRTRSSSAMNSSSNFANMTPPLTPGASTPSSTISSSSASSNNNNIQLTIETVIARARNFERVGNASLPPLKLEDQHEAEELLASELKTKASVSDPEEQEDGENVLVSAPGKVILFGEHAVVHGVTGIAASVSLRCYALLSPTVSSTSGPSSADPTVTLTLPDLSFSQSFSVASLPSITSPSSSPSAPQSIDPTLMAEIEALADAKGDAVGSRERMSVCAFLYLVVVMSGGRKIKPMTFIARSALPMGAGLGSSAAYSTCIALALLRHRRHLPSLSSSSLSPGPAFDAASIDLIDGWAFLAEKVIHGNPSGIDNAVSVRGGAVVFKRKIEGVQEGGMESLKSFSSIKFLITDSRVSRDTKTLVAHVTSRLVNEPTTVRPVMDDIQRIADDAKRCLGSEKVDRKELIHVLEASIEQNHAHLAFLGVSHPALEKIISLTRAAPYDLRTKLTGAGGGGCAVTLIPDHLEPNSLLVLTSQLSSEGFSPYLTAVGGAGVGLYLGGEDGQDLARGLEEKSTDDLEGWSRGLGAWGYA